MKKCLLFICVLLLFCSLHVFAQRQNVYYLKNDGKQVSTKDSADFIRIISEPDSGSTTNPYNISEYYANGKVKLLSKTASPTKVLLEYQCIRYYPSGKKQQIANYFDGKLDGDAYDYYPNGVLYTHKRYVSKQVMVIACNDSTGKVLVVDGNGIYIKYAENANVIDFKNKVEEGEIKGNKKQGVWKGRYISQIDTILYEELYSNDIFISGKSTDSGGKTYSYKMRETPPEFMGGESAFSQFLSSHIRYPTEAKRNNRQGRTFVQFMVESDGTLTNFKILRDPGDRLGDEAMRVLKLSPKWIPGVMYGKPVRVQYTVPINFSLRE